MIVWNWPFAVASAFAVAAFLFHVIVGGRRSLSPMLAEDGLPRHARMTLWYVWHLISAGLLATALVFLGAALRPEWIVIAWAVGLLLAVFSVIALAQTVLMRLPVGMVPHWILFAPAAALAIWGAMR